MQPIIDRKLPIPDKNDMKQWIYVEEAREHNLKGIDVWLPRNRFIVVTGLSGSGKSSLAIDTLFVEGQRRFVESLSSYARQFLGQLEKPHVKAISGLSPAICIEQKTSSHNPRSTVATVTEIMDYMRILYATVGKPHCPKCGDPIKAVSAEEIVDQILELPEGTRFKIIAPIITNEKGTHKKTMQNLQKEGYSRLEVNGREVFLDDEIPNLDKAYRHDISIVLDRLVLKEDIRSRLTNSVEIALEKSKGQIIVDIVDKENPKKVTYNEYAGCTKDGISIPELSPRMFSFNNPIGACPECMGLGVVKKIDPDLIVLDTTLSVRDGALATVNSEREDSWQIQGIESVLHHYGYDLDTPMNKLSKKVFNVLLYGSGKEVIKFSKEMESKDGKSTWRYEAERPTEGIVKGLERRYQQTSSENARNYYEQYMSEKPCASCNGMKLQPTSLGVKINDFNIMDVSQLSVKEALKFFRQIEFDEKELKISEQVMKEILSRLSFLGAIGLEYLTLDRKASTLSGGESQRIRLATQIGSRLVGVMYVLDEPSIGLHQRDNARLLETFLELRDLGNTIIVIEHDEETIRSADYIIDMGPLAGINGGEVVYSGSVEDMLTDKNSLTAKYLRYDKSIETPVKRRKSKGEPLKIINATHNNLKKIDVEIPLGVFTVVTGVSGSGKSTLINEILWKALSRKFNKSQERPGSHKRIENIDQLNKVIMIDQRPIGRTPRSNPATYTKVYDEIRKLYSMSPEAKVRGFKPGRFSFNVKGGRCEPCSGNGYNKIEMSFLSDVYVTCDICKGKRFNRETLEIDYKGKNIADVLDMDIEEAAEFFKNVPNIKRILDTLISVGCGYIKLGQSATTLSGGESQRIKLSRELSKRTTGNTLILLDEPSTGLHAHDVKKLLEVLHKLVNKGNTVLTIEHNLDIIKNADYIIDLGPEGGEEGGYVVGTGTPEDIIKITESFTGMFLKESLEREKEIVKKINNNGKTKVNLKKAKKLKVKN
jgi:excinuclease ABC subunit A